MALPPLTRTNWPKRWKKLQTAIDLRISKDGSLARFRRDCAISDHIQTRHSKLPEMLERCIKYGIPSWLWHDPRIGDPIGKQVTQDRQTVFVTASSLRMAMHAWRIRQRWCQREQHDPIRVVEIGAGYGGLSYALSQVFGISHYYYIDGPPLLQLQKFYTRACGIRYMWTVFAKPEEIELIKTADLVINVNSFAEMTQDEVDYYFRWINCITTPGGLFYSFNREHRNVRFANYPYGDYWERSTTIHHSNYTPFVECFAYRREEK